jgi:SOS-response transcriptional repressor LexA
MGKTMTSTSLRVKELLKEFGWTTKVLAEKTGMSESYLTHIKNGTRRWNEDALKKIAEAFEKNPVELFAHRSRDLSGVVQQHQSEMISAYRSSLGKFSQHVAMVPVLKDIPEVADPQVYAQMQLLGGNEKQLVPIFNLKDPLAFGLVLDSNLLAPRFLKGDVLIVSPKAQVQSGDLVVLEYKHDKVTRGLMVISFMDTVVVLEHPNHRLSPIAMTRNDHYVKILGKVVFRYQKY